MAYSPFSISDKSVFYVDQSLCYRWERCPWQDVYQVDCQFNIGDAVAVRGGIIVLAMFLFQAKALVLYNILTLINQIGDRWRKALSTPGYGYASWCQSVRFCVVPRRGWRGWRSSASS
ncbi:uncharacterized protein [Physcomitrium patens]|uniref:uncharacterized protein isoform X1 n=1 Tax=Physcomitrium patens TaxID=3218 RepID=UPI003CCDF16E